MYSVIVTTGGSRWGTKVLLEQQSTQRAFPASETKADKIILQFCLGLTTRKHDHDHDAIYLIGKK